jgi:hypothetical protein
MNAAVIGAPERSEMPEVVPKDTDRDRDVKPAGLQGADRDAKAGLEPGRQPQGPFLLPLHSKSL